MAHFVLWALDALRIAYHLHERGGYRLQVPLDDQELFGGAEEIRFVLEAERASGDAWAFRPGSPLMEWLLQRLRAAGPAVHARPACQPMSVHEISGPLFESYTVEGGRAYLSGCRLEDRPLLRWTCLDPQSTRTGRIPVAADAEFNDENGHEQGGLQHIFFDGEEPADPQLLEQLQLDDIQAYPPPVPRTPADLQTWVDTTRARLVDVAGRSLEPWVAALVWCKYVQGKVAFTIGAETVELVFSGWARLLADRHIDPPPYQCRWTGRRSYHLAATDDGRITVAEGIGICDASGRRVLESDLEQCELTGRRVLPEFLETCPATQQRLVRGSLVECDVCRQQVSPQALSNGQCQACRSRRPVRKDEPRLARVLGEYPRLDRWRSWQLAETATVYVLVARSWMRRLLLVVEKESLQPLRVAWGGRFAGRWRDALPAERDELLQ